MSQPFSVMPTTINEEQETYIDRQAFSNQQQDSHTWLNNKLGLAEAYLATLRLNSSDSTKVIADLKTVVEELITDTKHLLTIVDSLAKVLLLHHIDQKHTSYFSSQEIKHIQTAKNNILLKLRINQTKSSYDKAALAYTDLVLSQQSIGRLCSVHQEDILSDEAAKKMTHLDIFNWWSHQIDKHFRRTLYLYLHLTNQSLKVFFEQLSTVHPDFWEISFFIKTIHQNINSLRSESKAQLQDVFRLEQLAYQKRQQSSQILSAFAPYQATQLATAFQQMSSAEILNNTYRLKPIVEVLETKWCWASSTAQDLLNNLEQEVDEYYVIIKPPLFPYPSETVEVHQDSWSFLLVEFEEATTGQALLEALLDYYGIAAQDETNITLVEHQLKDTLLNYIFSGLIEYDT